MRKLCLLLLTVCFATFVNAQNVNVNPGAGSYPTLKAAFDAINAGTHTGSITVDIVGNTTEAASAVLNASGVGSASYSQIIISPSGGASRTITGAIAGALIDLNGADNVTIDGLNAGGNSLTISNTSTGAASAIRLINDASTNIIQNCTIQGSASTAAFGTIFFSTGTTTGNDDNNINNNIITAAGANLPINGVFSSGTSAAIDNSGNTLEANQVSDFFSAGSVSTGINLAATGNSTWTITNNKLFQTATRIYTTSNTHSGIFVGVGSGYNISGNIIGFANAGGTGTTNIVGNSVALTGTFPSSYTTTGTATATRYIAINCAFTAGGTVSSLQNNTMAGFALYTSSGAGTTNGIWCGINITSGSANVGTAAGNTIGATTGNSSIYTATTSAGGAVVGIYATSTNTVNIQNNTIGAIDAVGTTTTLSGAFTGIDVAGTGGVFTISNNTIGNATANNIRTGYTVTAGNLSNTGTITSTTGTTSPLVGIRHTATGATVAINSNILRGWQNGTTAGGATTGITSSGAVTSSATINNNQLGTASLGWMTWTFANTGGTVTGISLTGAGTATTHSIQTNDFRGLTYTVSGTSAHTYITLTGAISANDVATIANNTFTNLNVNTTGSVTFISHSYTMAATGTQTINNNSIVTGFNKGGAGGTVSGTSTGGSSVNGSICNITNNNFSNITVTGATAITGINNTDGLGTGTSAKTITGNTFNAWTGGTSTILGLNISYFHTGTSTISSNTITNITGQANITGISINASANSATSLTIGSNTINNLSSTGTGGTVIGITSTNTSPVISINNNAINTLSSANASGVVSGINIGGATTTNIFKNRIYDLSGTQAGTTINGINITSGTTLNIHNNLIGDLRATTATGLNAINGINANATATYNVYYNTIYLNATSTSVTTFGTSCITFSSTATSFNSRNNILFNTSIPAQEGANVATNGITAALRRSAGTASTVPANYAVTSNNNAYWVNPSAGTNNHLTYVEGTATITNPKNTFVNMKAFMANRDQASAEENVSWQSTSGANPNFLKYNTGTPSQLESGAANIATYTDDYVNTIRQGNPGYAGTGTAPDMGAWELEGIGLDLTGPAITYTALNNTSCTTDRTLTPTITDGSGVNTTPGTKPRLYYKKSTDADTYAGNTSADNGWKYVEATNAASPFSFTTDYSLLTSPVVTGDSLSYFVVAQDLAGTPNIGINSGTFAAPPTSVVLTAGAFPLTGTVNGYRIVTSVNGTVTIGAAGTYTSLTGATNSLFLAINTNGMSGNVTANIIDASVTETGATALNAINYTGCAAGPYTLTIKPNAATTSVLSGTNATALIDLNGADNVTIDGSNNGTTSKDLTISNTNTTGAGIRFINDATSNTVKNSILLGVSTSSTNGTVFFSTSTGALGNSNNTINNCDIRDGSTVPVNAVYSSGSVGGPNASNTISGCRIFNFSGSGVLVASTGTGDGWTINPNSFYQTATRTSAITVISVQSGSGHSIINNSIGGAAPDRSGTPAFTTTGTFTGISLAVGTTSATSVQGNTLSNINVSGGSTQTFKGINVTAGNVNIGTSTGNTIGGLSAAYDTVRTNYDGDMIEYSGAGIVNIENNTVGNVSYYNAGGDRLFGIRGLSGTVSIKNNIVRDLKSNGTSTAFSFFPGGIWLATTVAGANVEGNQVYNISHTNAGTSAYTVAGIYVASVSSTGTATNIRKNKVYGITAAGTGAGTSSARAWGIYVASGSATYSNNMISVGTGSGLETRFNGIEDVGSGINNYYFNSVSITGTTSSGTNNSYAFNRSGTATVDIKDNIFSNTRTGGTGFHVSIANTNAAATGWAATASNYNDLYNVSAANLTQWLGSAVGNNLTFAGWKAAQPAGSGGDANSWNINPAFTNPATDLHIPFATSTPLESGGTAAGGITTDIDNHVRPGPAGSVNGGATAVDIGADEFDGIPATAMVYVSSTTTQNTANVALGSTNQHVIGIQIVTTGSLSPLTATSFTIGTTGTTNLADITNAKLWYTGTSSTFATSTQFGSILATPVASFNITGSQALQEGTNYFWLTYDVPCTATVTNVIDGECTSFNIGSVQSPTPQAPAGSRTIIAGTGLSGTKTVGTGGDYLTLTDAAAAVNVNGLSGALTLSILNSLSEPGAVVFNALTYTCGGPYVLTIKPASTVTATVSGTVASGALIKLNGTDYVTIDGSNNGTNSRDLTFNNLSTTSPAVIWLASTGAAAGADNNTIKNCIITTGSNAATSYGIALAGATLGSGGADNDNVTIQNNNITQVYHGIWANGTAAVSAGGLDALNINNNIIGPATNGANNIGFSGINLANAVSPSVSTNTVQWMSASVASAAGVIIASTVTGATVTSNTIQDLNSTTAGFFGISVAGGATLTSNNVYRITGNTSSSGSTFVAGIEVTTTGAVVTLDKNKVDSVANSHTGTWGASGIDINGGAGHIVQNNFVTNVCQNMTGGAAFSPQFGVTGIRLFAGTGHKVYHNSVNLFRPLTGTATTSLLTAAFALNTTSMTGCDVRNNIFSNTMTGGTTSIAHVSVFLPSSGTTAMELTWNNNAYYSGTTAGSAGIAHVGATYTASPAGPATYAGLYTAANFVAASTTGINNLRSYTNILLTANTNNDNASMANTTAAPFTSNTDLHIPFATNGQLESGGAAVGVALDIDGHVRPGPAGSVNGGASAADIGADEFDGIPAVPMTFVSSTVTQANTSNVSNNAVNQEVIGIQIVTTGTLNPLSATSFTFNTNGTTAPLTDVTNAKLWYTGTSSTFAATTQFGSTVVGPNGSFPVTGSQILSEGTNYFWLTYDLPCTATLTNVIDGECNSLTVGIPYVPTVQAPAGSRTIFSGTFSGTKTIGTGGDYATLTAAFAALNSIGMSGNTIFNILNSITEPGAVVINQWPECTPGGYTLVIKPAAAATPTISASSTTAVIVLNGADRVTIDGSNNGTSSRDLTISNTSTAANTAAIWVSSLGTGTGATNNTIKNCNIKAGNNGAAANTFGIYAGGTSISTSGTGNDNDNLTIDNNSISKAYYGIYAQAASTGVNDNLTITGNSIGSETAADYVTFRGMLVSQAINAVVSRNTVFNMIAGTEAAILRGMEFGSGVTNTEISRNKIYNIRNTTTTLFRSGQGLSVNTTAPANITIANNVIYGLSGHGSTTTTNNAHGILLLGGGGYNIYFNSVNLSDNITATGSVDNHSCMYIASTVTAVNLRNNVLATTAIAGNTTSGKTYGIYCLAANTAFTTINYNDFYAPGTSNRFAGFITSDRTTLGDIQAGFGQNVNSIVADPLFNSGSVLAPLAGSPLLSAGENPNTTGISIDYLAAARGTPPTIGAYEQAGDFAAPTITYSLLGNTLCATDRTLSPVTITDGVSGVNITAGTRPRLYFKKTTNANTYVDNTNATNGWKYVEATGAGGSPFSFTTDFSLVNGGVAAGDVIQYFVTAQDLAGTPNVSINSGAFAATPASVALTSAAFPIGGSVNQFTINTGGLSGTVTIGATGTFPSLTGAGGLFAFVNASGLTGNLTVNILDASITETGINSLNQIAYPCAVSPYTMTIKPDAGVTSTVTGTLSNAALIRILSGNVVIDGSNNGTTSRNLTITNTSATGPSVILFGSVGTVPISNSTVKNSTIINGSQNSSAVVITDGTTLGNPGYFNNITVQNNSIQQAYIGVYSNAVFATGNGSGTLITGNDLNTAGASSIRLVGLYAQGIDGVTISNNNIANISNANAESPRAIWLASGTNSGTVSGNNISTLALTNTGAFNLTGIYITPGSGATGITVNSNTISGLTNAGTGTSFGGIVTTSPNTNVTNNTISNLTQNGAATVYGIVLSGASISTVSSNTISGILSSTSGTASGINIQGASTNMNIFWNSISNIKNTNVTGAGANGIQLSSSSTTANVNVYNNQVYDVAANGVDAILSTSNGYGIMVSTGGGYNIRFNSINMNTNQVVAAGRPAAINISSAITTAASLDIRDNILANTQTTGNRYAIVSGAANTVYSNINYNDYHSTGTAIGYNGTTEYANLAAWQGASGQDLNSVAVDPLFTSPTNLNLQAASPLISAGVTVGGITYDFVNSTRNSPPSIGAYENKIVFSAKVFLQGAYNAGLGQHRANTAQWTTATNAAALTQPYTAAPFSYAGTESVSAGFFANTAGTTDPMDWVLLELRDASTPTTVVSRRAAIIREDGLIVDLDGVSPVGFRGFNAGTYFVVIRHRNHLGVRTGTTQLVNGFAGTPPTYDFTTAQSQALQDVAITTNAAMAQNGSVFLLWAGNANQDVYVRATTRTIPLPVLPSDAAAILVLLGGDPNATGGYTPGDVNMDGYTRATTRTIPLPVLPSDAAFILSTPLSGVPNATRQEHKVNN